MTCGDDRYNAKHDQNDDTCGDGIWKLHADDVLDGEGFVALFDHIGHEDIMRGAGAKHPAKRARKYRRSRYPHVMKLLVEDFWGKRFELYVGKLNHSGWKLMTVAIPPQNSAGKTGIIQKDYHYGTSTH